MATLVDLVDELRDVILNSFVTVTDIDIQVLSGRVVNPSPPTIDIYPAETPRDPGTAAYGDIAGAYLFTVRARVATGDFDAGQDFLFCLMDDENELCLAAAVEEDPTLNGLAFSVDVMDHSGIGEYRDVDGALSYLGCQWTVRVINATS